MRPDASSVMRPLHAEAGAARDAWSALPRPRKSALVPFQNFLGQESIRVNE